MRYWLSKQSAVPARDQLATQVMLGVLSGDLPPGQRLPSVRDLARRLGVHANTVSAAYQDLEQRGWVERRPGSGVYVRARGAEPVPQEGQALDQLFKDLLGHACRQGLTLAQVQERLRPWLVTAGPGCFLLVEPEPELRAVLLTEIAEQTSLPIRGVGLEESRTMGFAPGAVVTALYSRLDQVQSNLPPHVLCVPLHTASVPDSLKGQSRPPATALFTVVSRSAELLHWTRHVLIAAGLDPDALCFRHAQEPGWQDGLGASSLVIADVVTARELAAGLPVRVMRVLSPSAGPQLARWHAFFSPRL